ncbi:MAG: YbaK/EbsC family protein [Candidatus Omnitrophica bacterium]|nr:YbaK/EbsC family protein [Candidatus Omnitrophota bacterium]
MAISEKLKAFLDGARVTYTVGKHAVVYTAQEIAAAQHVSGRQLAKCVLVKTDQGPVLAVLPAVCLVDLKRLKALLGAKTVTIAKEADIKAQFPDVEVGAMSPFGNLYGVPVAVDQGFSEAEAIVFNAGTHADTITMRYADFANLVKPKAGAFGQAVNPPKPAKKASKKAARTRPARRRAGRKPRPLTTSRQPHRPGRARRGGRSR